MLGFIIFLVIVSVIFLYFNNDNSDKKIIEILPDNYYEIKLSEDVAYKNIKLTKEIKKELSNLLIANNAKELKKDSWLKLEPMKFIKILCNGKIKLLIYTENYNTYIECYENGKVIKTYILENDVTEEIKKIFK